MNDQIPDISEAKRIAGSPAGQQLLSLLREKDNGQLNKALEKAFAGDYMQAKEVITTLLETPEAKELLNQLGGTL